ncbi:MAG: DUF6498-containing protein [Pseudomonadota bacterium]
MRDSGAERDRVVQKSALALMISNALPILGVLFLGWDVGAIVVLYWSENLILGAYNIAKMVYVGGVPALGKSAFFLLHYGGFCAVHGLFILLLLLDTEPALDDLSWPFILIFVELLVAVCSQMLATAPSAWILAFVGLFISHGYSFAMNFIGGGEYRHTTVNKLMAAPYLRIVALHVAIIVGGFAVISLGQPTVLLLVLIGLKTFLDLKLHRRSHSSRERGAEPDSGYARERDSADG